MLNTYHLCTYTNTNILTPLYMWINVCVCVCVCVCVNKGPVRLHIKLIKVVPAGQKIGLYCMLSHFSHVFVT